MIRKDLRARASAVVETTSVIAIRADDELMNPAAFTVASTQAAGTAASADRPRAVRSPPVVIAMPRRARRERSKSRAPASRRRTVASPQLSSCGLGVCLPSRSHSKRGSRYFSESRASSSCRTCRVSLPSSSRGGAVAEVAGQSLACPCDARPEYRPEAQSDERPDGASVPRASPPRIDLALQIRTRNVAWKASSASFGSRSTARQMPRTIGPCRWTRAANAASSPPGEEPFQELAVGETRESSPRQTGSGSAARQGSSVRRP